MILETKTDHIFSIGNFLIDGFSTPFWSDRDATGEQNVLATENVGLEGLYIESIRYSKKLLKYFYNLQKNITEKRLGVSNEYLYLYSSNYEKKSILGDFNDKNQMKCFCDTYGLKSLIKQPTCYKTFEKPTCRDLMLANVPYSFYSNEC